MVEVNNKMCYSLLGLPPRHGKIHVSPNLYNRNPNIMVGTTMMGQQLRGSSIHPLSSTDESLPSMTTTTPMNCMNPCHLTASTTTGTSTSGGRLNLLDPTSITSSCGLRMADDLQTGFKSICRDEINNIIIMNNVNNIMDVMGAMGMNNNSVLQLPTFDHHVTSVMSTRVHDVTKKLENHNSISSTMTLLLPSSSLLASATPTMSLFEKISKATMLSSSSTTSKEISSGDCRHAAGGVATRVLSSTSSINNKRKKRGHPKCRPIDPNMDPKKAKRVLANRLSAQKSRLRKLAYLAELEKTVLALETRVGSIAPKVAQHDQQRLLTRMENTSMKKKIAILISEQAFKDAQFQALKEERDKLVELYMLQQQQKAQFQALKEERDKLVELYMLQQQQNLEQLQQHQLQEKLQQQLRMIDIFEPLQQPNLALPMNGSENVNGINLNGKDIDGINTNSVSNDHVDIFM